MSATGCGGPRLLWAALATAPAAGCVRGSPCSGAPLVSGRPPPQPLRTVPQSRAWPGRKHLSPPWQQKWGRDLQMCWEASRASSWGSQAFRICGGGAGPLPPSDTGCEECPGLNGPCVKLPGGGQSPRTPPKARLEPSTGPEREAPHGLCTDTYTELSPRGAGAYTAPLSRVPSHSNTHFTTQAQDQGLHHHHTWSASHSSTSFQAPSGVGKGRKVNPILEMREQRLTGEVRGCPRRN